MLFVSLNTFLYVFPHQLLLEVENINCIAVDWEDGAKGTYVSAVNNIRVVGAEVAYFLKILQVKDTASPPTVLKWMYLGYDAAALIWNLVQYGQPVLQEELCNACS